MVKKHATLDRLKKVSDDPRGSSFVVVSERLGLGELMPLVGVSSLSPQEEKYCLCRANGMDHKTALAEAHIEVIPRTAQRWESQRSSLFRKEIVSRILEFGEALRAVSLRSAGVNREWVITQLKTIIERCVYREGEPIKVKETSGVWKETGRHHKADFRNAIAAIALLARHLGMFDQKGNAHDPYAHYTDDELYRLARDLAQKLGIALTVAQPASTEAREQTLSLPPVSETKGLS